MLVPHPNAGGIGGGRGVPKAGRHDLIARTPAVKYARTRLPCAVLPPQKRRQTADREWQRQTEPRCHIFMRGASLNRNDKNSHPPPFYERPFDHVDHIRTMHRYTLPKHRPHPSRALPIGDSLGSFMLPSRQRVPLNVFAMATVKNKLQARGKHSGPLRERPRVFESLHGSSRTKQLLCKSQQVRNSHPLS